MESSRPPTTLSPPPLLPAALLRVHGTCPAIQNESALDLFVGADKYVGAAIVQPGCQ